MVQMIVSQLPHDAIPEMTPPTHTVLVPPPAGSTRPLDMFPDCPYFNGSLYCNRLSLRFSLWLRNPATIALISAFRTYYREAARERSPPLVMLVKGGARCVHGYYVNLSLHDAFSAWCDLQIKPIETRQRIPPPLSRIRLPVVDNTETTMSRTMDSRIGTQFTISTASSRRQAPIATMVYRRTTTYSDGSPLAPATASSEVAPVANIREEDVNERIAQVISSLRAGSSGGSGRSLGSFA